VRHSAIKIAHEKKVAACFSEGSLTGWNEGIILNIISIKRRREWGAGENADLWPMCPP
jgi:hypothetical protein